MAFIIKPLVTEKMTKITEKKPNRYGFVVRPEANSSYVLRPTRLRLRKKSRHSTT